MRQIWKAVKAAALKQTGVPEEDLRNRGIEAGIQACIDAAWESRDLECRELQQALFPSGKPTPAEFIAVLAARVREQISEERDAG